MKVTLLGHASVLVEIDGAACLMDPVLFDPFEEGTVVSCPRRTVYPEQLPPIDILIVSHRHPDHFDIPSLARLPRELDAICPADPLIVYALKELGFRRVHAVHPMAPISSSGFELYPTRSEVPGLVEFGMVFKDSTGIFWNQVDSSLSDETIDAVRSRFGKVGLLFAMYASQNFEFFESRSTSFPGSTHRWNLKTALAIRPSALAPGSAGFRFCGDHDWLNPFLFPISRERFLADIRRLDPAITTFVANPGDIFEIAGAEVRRRAGGSAVARMEADDTWRIGFNPLAPIPDLDDPNPYGHSLEYLGDVTYRFVAEGILRFARDTSQAGDKVVAAYRDHGVHYAVALVFPDATVRWYSLAFTATEVEAAEGEGTAQGADMVHRIAASALVDWIECRKSFFYVRAYSRRHTMLYRLARDQSEIRLEPILLPDLLMYYLLNVAVGSEFSAKRHLERQLQDVRRPQNVSD